MEFDFIQIQVKPLCAVCARQEGFHLKSELLAQFWVPPFQVIYATQEIFKKHCDVLIIPFTKTWIDAAQDCNERGKGGEGWDGEWRAFGVCGADEL